MAKLSTESVSEPKKISQVIHYDLGDHSHGAETLLADSGTYEVGEVLGVVSASGKRKKYDNAAIDGSEVAVEICRERVDTTGADVTGVAVEQRVATLLTEGLEFDAGQDQAAQDAAVLDLQAVGFKVQQGIGG